MNRFPPPHARRVRASDARAAAAAWLLAACALGCSSLTDVDDPGIVQPADLDSPSGALLRRAGAVQTFASAYTRQAVYTGAIADELFDQSHTNVAADRRLITTVDGGRYPYQELSTARMAALRALASLRRFQPDSVDLVGELYAVLGYVDVFFAENLCNGVPLGVLVDGVARYGPVVTRAQLRDQAIAHFDSAGLAESDSVRNLVAVGRGRALLDAADFDAAAAAVAAIPTGFAYSFQFSASVPNYFHLTFTQGETAVSDREGRNGLDFRTSGDPRIGVTPPTISADGDTVAGLARFATPAAPLVLASGVEARLIEAEAALRRGDAGTWLATLNSLRQGGGVSGLAPLADPGTDAARVALTFRERAFWLFATGHRQGDLRRLIREYGVPTEEAFPTGVYFAGTLYGPDVTFVPFRESGNPNFSGCADRDP